MPLLRARSPSHSGLLLLRDCSHQALSQATQTESKEKNFIIRNKAKEPKNLNRVKKTHPVPIPKS